MLTSEETENLMSQQIQLRQRRNSDHRKAKKFDLVVEAYQIFVQANHTNGIDHQNASAILSMTLSKIVNEKYEY